MSKKKHIMETNANMDSTKNAANENILGNNNNLSNNLASASSSNSISSSNVAHSTALAIPSSRSMQIVRPPSIMPATPTSSPNTHEWTFSSNFLPSFLQLPAFNERLPFLPPVPHSMATGLYTLSAPSSAALMQIMEKPFLSTYSPASSDNNNHTLKMRSYSYRSRNKLRNSPQLGNWKVKSNGRKLRTAAYTSNIDALRNLLENGADPNAADELQRSPLHLAACRGYVAIVQELIKFGANPNVVDSLGNTPLHLAVMSAFSNNFNVVVRVLLQAGAFVHMYDRNNQTPLQLAEGKLRMLRARYQTPTGESAAILEDMCMLTALIMSYMVKQQKELDDLNTLEQRLKNLSTSEKEDRDEVVTQTADELLASLERLSLK